MLRIYDKDGFRRRAACICVRSEEEAEVSKKGRSASGWRKINKWVVCGIGKWEGAYLLLFLISILKTETKHDCFKYNLSNMYIG